MSLSGESVESFSHKPLQKGDKVTSKSGFTYCVLETIHHGKFGDVFICSNSTLKDGKRVVMRTEVLNLPEKHLKRILTFLWTAMKTDKSGTVFNAHFCRPLDSGATPSLNFIIVDELGPNLEEVRKQLGKDYSIASACHISLQMLEAIQGIHKMGYVHRDIRPSAFRLYPSMKRRLYLGSMGHIRRIREIQSTVGVSRQQLRIRESPFLPRAISTKVRYGPKDDMESWVYTCADVFSKDILPWTNNTNQDEVLKLKNELCTLTNKKMTDSFVNNAPRQLLHILRYLHVLRNCESIDYEFMRKIFRRTIPKDLMVTCKDLPWLNMKRPEILQPTKRPMPQKYMMEESEDSTAYDDRPEKIELHYSSQQPTRHTTTTTNGD